MTHLAFTLTDQNTLVQQGRCAQCAVKALCLPVGLTAAQWALFGHVVGPRLKVLRGEALFHAGEPMGSLYAVRMGSFKTTLVSQDGRAQVTGFWMAGDVIGLDAISGNRHLCTALAIEDSDVCPLSFSQVERLGREVPSLQHHLNCLLSSEIGKEHHLRLSMGSLGADARLAAFLLDLSRRQVERGYSAHGFILRMSREDIASYLGLRLETVCRSIARLRQAGLVRCRGRVIDLLDLHALEISVTGDRHDAA